jgi:uncharacterized protein YkwD
MKLFLYPKHSLCLLVVLFQLYAYSLKAQAPANLTADVVLTATTETDFAPFAFFSSVSQIAAAFNKARRTEETQLGLAANSLGTLVLPAGYATFTDNQRAVFLINAERQARAGINYGSGPVLGKPLEGIETALDNTAQGHADYLFTTNTFGHTGADGSTPFQRVEATYPANCLQRNGAGNYTMGRSENAYQSCGGGATYVVEQAIFSWLYQDMGSAWGHRETVLIQNVDASGFSGFNDDRSPAGNEGFLGIGVKIGTGYTPCGTLPARLVIMNIADPSGDAACTFSLENSPLPVSITFWKGHLEQNTVKLEWETAWEKNADYFLIQHSTDIEHFDTLGSVKSRGNTTQRQAYVFTDETPALGDNYYRLIQIDTDGVSQTSRIISVHRDNNASVGGLSAYPNPINKSLPFRLLIDEAISTDVHLVDVLGVEIPVNQSRINKQELLIRPKIQPSTGIYFIIAYINGKRHSTKLIIN